MMMNPIDVNRKSLRRSRKVCSAARRQQGVVLYVALVVMVVMMLAGVAMLRSVGAGVGVAGNLAFKQNATLAGDLGTQAAITWILTQSSADLESDIPASGYFASWVPGFDPLIPFDPSNPASFDWTSAVLVPNPAGVPDTGNKVRYVIHRLCKATGFATSSPTQECTMSGVVSPSAGAVIQVASNTPPLFRVTTRVDGPRGTLSYIQVVIE